jgi:hypothetical protein
MEPAARPPTAPLTRLHVRGYAVGVSCRRGYRRRELFEATRYDPRLIRLAAAHPRSADLGEVAAANPALPLDRMWQIPHSGGT